MGGHEWKREREKKIRYLVSLSSAGVNKHVVPSKSFLRSIIIFIVIFFYFFL